MRVLIILILILPVFGLSQSDTTYHFYVNSDISVEITPWENGRRTINLYDLKGQKTFSIEEVKLSYSVRNTFKFYDNGGVKEMVEHMNPGASRYFYETTITFNSTNTPQIKKTKRIPESIEDIQNQPTYYWHTKSKTWKKQEVISCDPPRD